MHINRVMKFTLILLPWAVFYLACEDHITDGPLTRISGIVIDATSGLPVDSASISLNDTLQTTEQIHTDSIGRYHVYMGGFGTIRVFCRKEGYMTEQAVVQSTLDNLTIKDVNFVLKK